MKNKIPIFLAGAVIGVIAIGLTFFGNPLNMGLCIACFLRDTAGAIGLHRAEVVQYIRPEIIGLILGALIMAFSRKEFQVRGGSSPITRFFLGIIMIVGALMFLGCPLRMILRLGGGDLNAIVGLVGFIGGILIGIVCLNKGFTLKRSYKMNPVEGLALPGMAVGLLVLLLLAPAFIFFSAKGPGSQHAPIIIALVAGLIAGALAQRFRICTVGGFRDAILFKDFNLFSGLAGIFLAVLIGNLILGNFHLGFTEQPIAHNDALWNFLGMTVCGWAAVLLGGCPLRQLILAGSGNVDSALTVLGMIVGGALCHNFGLAASAAGPTGNGKIAIIICFLLLAIIAVFNKEGKKNGGKTLNV